MVPGIPIQFCSRPAPCCTAARWQTGPFSGELGPLVSDLTIHTMADDVAVTLWQVKDAPQGAGEAVCWLFKKTL